MRVPRSRGAVSGLLLILLGAWGALIPFIGPYLDYSYGTDQTWHWTTARLWLEVLPGIATALGGLLLLVSANRIRGSFGGWLAALAGAWFVVGTTLAPLLHLGSIGQPLSQSDRGRAAAQIGYFNGLGAVILFLAAFALGRLAVVGVRDLRAAERDELRAAEQARADEELARRRALERDAHTDDETVATGTAAGATAAGGAQEPTARYEPDRPYGSQSHLPDEPTARYNPGGVGSDYGSPDATGRPPAHQAPGDESR